MSLPAIYVFNNGSTHLELEKSDEWVEVLSTNGNRCRLSVRDILSGVVKRVELPADLRKWDPKIRRVWLKHRLNVMKSFLYNHPLRGASTRISVQSNIVNEALEYADRALQMNAGSSAAEDVILQAQQFYPILEKQSQLRGKRLTTPAKSRRVKQRIAREKHLEGLPKVVNKTYPRPKMKLLPYPNVPKNWFIHSLPTNLGEALALSGHKHNGRNFPAWFEDIGQYIDCAPGKYYNLWLGTEDSLLLRQGDRDNTFYFRVFVGGSFVPWNWPYPKNLCSKEEVLALTGEPRRKDQVCFLEWYEARATVPHCGKHSSSPTSCRQCAELAYREWWKGK